MTSKEQAAFFEKYLLWPWRFVTYGGLLLLVTAFFGSWIKPSWCNWAPAAYIGVGGWILGLLAALPSIRWATDEIRARQVCCKECGRWYIPRDAP